MCQGCDDFLEWERAVGEIITAELAEQLRQPGTVPIALAGPNA